MTIHDDALRTRPTAGLLIALVCLAAACSDPMGEVVVEGDHPTYASVVAGLRHSCALDTEGAAYCWGYNGANELGVPQGGGVGRQPEPVSSSLRFAQLAAGNRFTCGLTTGGALYCWGWPTWGIFPVPTEVATDLDVVSVVAGANHVCGVLADGGSACWGLGSSGQLGNGRFGDTADERAPSRVEGLGDVRAVGSGATASCALDGDGAVWCWGAHDTGQLGVGDLPDGPCAVDGTDFPCLSTPARLEGLPAMGELAVGLFHACGVDLGGSTWCWGDDGDGQLDEVSQETCTWMPPSGAERACSRSPVEPFSVGIAFDRVYGGGFHACGLTAEGEAYCWGGDFLGQLGWGGGPIPDGPLPVYGDHRWRTLGLGQAHSCGVTLEGELYCWGDGGYDQLGAGTEFSPTPVRVLPIR